MLTPGNRKIGSRRLIWSFGLPSRSTCPGRSPACSGPCYSAHLEVWRLSVRRRYRRNLFLSRKPDFVSRVCAFLASRRVEVVRLHVAGDFYSADYARQWLTVMGRSAQTRFYLYTRSWRILAIRGVLRRMARMENVQVWFSCDRDTGVPNRLPRRVRLAWLMTAPDDLPPRADLVFRTHRLRYTVLKSIRATRGRNRVLVCPTENGITQTTCDRCGVCWRTPPSVWRLPLPTVPAPAADTLPQGMEQPDRSP